MSEIRFGTDGWRAVIAEDFTFENLRVVAQAYADHLTVSKQAGKGVAVSHDTRFMSARFASLIADVLAGNRIPVILSSGFTPTPVLSYTVKKRDLAGGIMVTASHNPFYYNGLKFKDFYGGPALPAFTRAVESRLHLSEPKQNPQNSGSSISREDLLQDYRSFLHSFIDMETLTAYPGQIVLDPMHGAACGFLESFLKEAGLKVDVLNGSPDPAFGGIPPEPIPKNLTSLSEAVRESGATLGIATDGDADRFGILDEKGCFVELHDLMPMLFTHLNKSRGWTGSVVRTTSMNDTIDRVAAASGITVEEVPVGFRNITEVMLQKDILIGGEESGGFGYKHHIPERDGILSALLLLEMLADGKQSISGRVHSLREKYGPFAYGRIDHYHDLDTLNRNLNELRNAPPASVAGFEITKVNLIDGIKFYFADSSWMLIRVSQTEPLGRIYVGSTHKRSVDVLLQAGLKLITK